MLNYTRAENKKSKDINNVICLYFNPSCGNIKLNSRKTSSLHHNSNWTQELPHRTHWLIIKSIKTHIRSKSAKTLVE